MAFPDTRKSGLAGKTHHHWRDIQGLFLPLIHMKMAKQLGICYSNLAHFNVIGCYETLYRKHHLGLHETVLIMDEKLYISNT